MRADKFFSERFLSRTKAAEALKRGLVLKDGKPLSPDDDVRGDETFEFLSSPQSFVSMGGYKLARGLETFGIDVTDKVYADLGASTGGFTDCLLKNGVRRVYCVDVGENQLDPRISADRRVCVMDKTNARYLLAEYFPERLDGVVSDLSFISLKLVLPAVKEILPEEGYAIVLFKPQFECGGKGVAGKSGIVSRAKHPSLLSDFFAFANGLSLAPLDIVNAPVREKKNVEYIVLLKKGGKPIGKDEFLRRAACLSEERTRK